MNNKHHFVNALLWAAAIFASAILGAPPFLTLVLLPGLAATALMTSRQKSKAARCRD